MRIRVVVDGWTILALVVAGFSSRALAQVPSRTSEPRLAVPRAEVPVAQPPGQPTAPQVITQPSGQTTAAATTDTTPPAGSTAAPVTAVTGGASGVTQLGGSASAPTTSSSSQAATADMRSYTAGRSMLALSGVQVGPVNSVEGGTATADVVTERVGPDHITKKHIAGVKYEDLTFDVGLESKPLLDWIAASLAGQYVRKDGSILGLDYNNSVRTELAFFHALPAGLTIPTLDAAAKDAASLTVTLTPEYTRVTNGSGAKAQVPPSKLQRWSSSGFRFEMAGLDGSRVNRIESFTIKQKVADNPVGEMRDYQKEPAGVEYPSLKISLAESSAQTWLNWQDDFVIKGNSGDDKERDGAIVFLSPMQTEVGRVNLFHCGIYRLAPQAKDSKAEIISRLTAELYCERMELQVPKS
jgi:tail tube protein gp19